jgi:hypothetical protein
MSLSSSDRKNLSKKYVLIPEENSAAQDNLDQLELLIQSFEDLDQSFKNLFDADNSIIELYHPEINYLAGNIRPPITEQDLINSAKKVPGNYFFPNDVPTPSLPDGVWKELKAFAKSVAIGKGPGEVYVPQDSEAQIISSISALTSYIQSNYSSSERQTGVPDVPPPPPFNLPTDLQQLKDLVDNWEAWLLGQEAALTANTDDEQIVEIAAALVEVQNTLIEVNSWQALADYAANGKVSNSGLALLNSAGTTRNAFIPTRIAQINSRLGDITQNSDGSISAFTGLYGARYINIDSRVNLADGTLSKITGLELGKRVQQETINNNNNYLTYLTDNILVSSKLAEDSNGSATIIVEDSTLFSELDSVYLVSETQSEVAANVVSIENNTIVLDINVPNTFTVSDLARLVKEV